MAEVPEAVRAAEEERNLALLDAGLHRVGLSLSDAPGLEVGVDLVDRRRLGRVLKLLRRDAEMPRNPCEEAVTPSRRALRGGDRAAGSHCERKTGGQGEDAFRVEVLHGIPFV